MDLNNIIQQRLIEESAIYKLKTIVDTDNMVVPDFTNDISNYERTKNVNPNSIYHRKTGREFLEIETYALGTE